MVSSFAAVLRWQGRHCCVVSGASGAHRPALCSISRLAGDWATHSLRSGVVIEAGRQGVPLGEVMAITKQRSVGTVVGYFQAGLLLSSRATMVLSPRLPPPQLRDAEDELPQTSRDIKAPAPAGEGGHLRRDVQSSQSTRAP